MTTDANATVKGFERVTDGVGIGNPGIDDLFTANGLCTQFLVYQYNDCTDKRLGVIEECLPALLQIIQCSFIAG